MNMETKYTYVYACDGCNYIDLYQCRTREICEKCGKEGKYSKRKAKIRTEIIYKRQGFWSFFESPESRTTLLELDDKPTIPERIIDSYIAYGYSSE
jgi:hypothetical protein